ncbi:sensor histidine kinase [Trichothermofontia sp.]
MILSDSYCLERILSEWLNNACKYTPPGEQIGLSVWLQAEDQPMSSLVLKVVNSGVEIPAEAQAHIFDKFYRVQALDRWNQGGTGLGLALVKELTPHLGGTIQLTSQANHTCFTVQLPLTVSPS